MENSVLSIDSLGESELDLLRDKLKQKDHIIAEKSEIISSLRQQVNDLNSDLEEMDNNQQILNQRVDRLTKDVREKDEELEAVSHALKEVETAHDNLSKRMEARTSQLQKFVEDLVAAKKELEVVTNHNEELKHKNEQLTIELQLANSKRRPSQEQEQQQECTMSQEHHPKHQIKREQEIKNHIHRHDKNDIHERYQRRAISMVTPEDDETKPELASALHFAMADEIGEIMDTSSVLPPRPFGEIHRHAQQTYTVPVPTFERATVTSQQQKQQNQQNLDWNKENTTRSEYREQIAKEQQTEQVIKQAQPSKDYCPNHRQKRAQGLENQVFDPITEHKLRMARASELARRNMQTKPLHQTSYPLELDTFDTTDITEHEIKRGNIPKSTRPPQRPPPLPPVQKHHHQHQQLGDTPPRHQQPKLRQALANCSNTPPVVRRVYKKAEAFIV